MFWVHIISLLLSGERRSVSTHLIVVETRNADLLKKKMEATFKKMGFKIEVEHSIKSTDFLDVVLDLETGFFKPFRKPGDVPNYIHVKTNHPQAILKQLPAMIENRLSANSSNEEIFNEAIPIYSDALKRSGYSHKLTYKPKEPQGNSEKKKKNRGRKVIWFNPPYNKAVSTDVGRKFLSMVDRYRNTPLGKILNRNYIRISYRTGKNVKRHIDSHNRAKLQKKEVERGHVTAGVPVSSGANVRKVGSSTEQK